MAPNDDTSNEEEENTSGYHIDDVEWLCELILNGNFEELKGKYLLGNFKRPPKRYNKELADEFKMLFKDACGRPALAFAMIVLTVPIRRNIDRKHHLNLFFKLWQEYHEVLLKGLDTRWLVSACDTFASHSEDASERGWAIAGSVFVNTIKLYETEMLYLPEYPDVTGPILRVNPTEFARRRGRLFLYDGVTPYRIEFGDMIANLKRRVNAARPDDPISALILRELFSRATAKQTVYKRMIDVRQKLGSNQK